MTMSTTQSGLHRVRLVLDREFGNRVLALATHMHVWVVDSPTNRVVADAIWSTNSSGAENCLNKGVTLFQTQIGRAPDVIVSDIFDTILDHHSEWACGSPMTEIEIYGLPDTEATDTALNTLGLDVIDRNSCRILCRISSE
jgi:hypothetical protein